jgi:hypothetical protein
MQYNTFNADVSDFANNETWYSRNNKVSENWMDGN